MNNLAHQASHDDGFTILEVLIALAILAISISALFGIFSDTLLQTDANRQQTIAGLHAETILAQIGSQISVDNKPIGGDFGDGFRWTIDSEAYGTRADLDAWPYIPQKFRVKILWQESGREKSLQLTSLRLLPRKKSP